LGYKLDSWRNVNAANKQDLILATHWFKDSGSFSSRNIEKSIDCAVLFIYPDFIFNYFKLVDSLESLNIFLID
jgi:hypothetical protein